MIAFLQVRKNYFLIMILIIAAVLRFVAIYPGFNPYHGDEQAIPGSAIKMVKNSTYDPGRYDYPATIMTINAATYKYFFIPISWSWYYISNFWDIVDGLVKVPPLEEEFDKIFTLHIVGERNIKVLFWSRIVTAFFGLGTVFLTYVLGKRLFSKKVGLLAALFLTFNYKNVVNSHLTLPDIYNAFFLLLSLITSWKMYEKPSRLNYLKAGIAAGFAFTVKYQFFPLMPFIVSHLLIVFENGFSFKKVLNNGFLVGSLFVPLIFLVTNPYFFLNFEIVVAKMNEEFLKYGMGANNLNLYPLSYLYRIDYGPPQFFLVLIGLVISMVKKTVRSLLLLSVILPVLFMFVYYSTGGFYVRNFIPITPLFLIFASVAFWEIINRIFIKLNKFYYKLLVFVFIAIVLFIPARNSVISSYGYSLPWNYDVLFPWIQDNLPKDVGVAVHPFDKTNLGITNKTSEFDPAQAYSLAEHKENGASYAVINMNWANITFYSWMNFDLDNLQFFWQKPLDILRNTYQGVAAEELIRYQIHTVTKPWQSPDMNFVVAKIPQWPEVEMRTIKSFSFNDDQEGWKTYGELHGYEGRYGYTDKIGHTSAGSLEFLPNPVRFPIVRITSIPLEISEGHKYKISGFLKTDKKLESRDRTGFLRLDFYEHQNDFEKVGVRSSVSSRVYGTQDWVEKELSEVAPKNSKFLTISFQGYVSESTKIWLDDVVVQESLTEVEDITQNFPYTKNYVDLNYLYPNSHGNL